MLSSRTELNVISNHQVLYLRKCHDKTAPHAVHVGQKTGNLSFARKADTSASFRRLCSGVGETGEVTPSRITTPPFKRCPKLQSQIFMAVPVPPSPFLKETRHPRSQEPCAQKGTFSHSERSNQGPPRERLRARAWLVSA